MIRASTVLQKTKLAASPCSRSADSESRSTEIAVGVAPCKAMALIIKGSQRNSKPRTISSRGKSRSFPTRADLSPRFSRPGMRRSRNNAPSRNPTTNKARISTSLEGHHSAAARLSFHGVHCTSNAPSRPRLAGLSNSPCAAPRSRELDCKEPPASITAPTLQVNSVAPMS